MPDLYEAYRAGFVDALRCYGIWKGGRQRIGCLDKSVEEIIKNLDSNSMFNAPAKPEPPDEAGK